MRHIVFFELIPFTLCIIGHLLRWYSYDRLITGFGLVIVGNGVFFLCADGHGKAWGLVASGVFIVLLDPSIRRVLFHC